MGSREFSEWQIYERFDPYGLERVDYGFALVCCTLANLYRGKDKPPFKPEDFLPRYGETAEDRQERIRQNIHEFMKPPTR